MSKSKIVPAAAIGKGSCCSTGGVLPPSFPGSTCSPEESQSRQRGAELVVVALNARLDSSSHFGDALTCVLDQVLDIVALVKGRVTNSARKLVVSLSRIF